MVETGEGRRSARADVVLEGGGVKGIGLVGALTALQAGGVTFERFAGTSAGAIVGALAASMTARGESVTPLVEIMRSVDYDSFRDETFLDHFGIIGKATELLVSRAVYSGDAFESWFEQQLAALGISTFADLRMPGADERDDIRDRYRLVVMTSDLTRGQLVRLPWDCHRYGLDPDALSVAAAVRASMSIPFFFPPVTIGSGDETATVVDGGLLSNFPYDAFDPADGHPKPWGTIGIKLSSRAGAWRVAHPTKTTAEFALAWLETLLAAHDAYHLDDEHAARHTVFVDTFGISAVDFSLSGHDQDRLFESGRRAGERFVDRWATSGTVR